MLVAANAKDAVVGLSTTMIASFRAKILDRRGFLQLADWLAVGVALSLPWSTSASGILIALWLLAYLPALDLGALRRELGTAAGGLPVLLWLLAALGMLWADVSWAARIDGLGGYHRLLVIPLLLVQFRHSDRGAVVLYGFLASTICLLIVSWAFALIPALATLLAAHGKDYGVPVKDYIFQSGIFLICAFGLIGVACEFARERKWLVVLASACVAALFITNIAFVVTSRTVLVVAPLLVVAIGYRQLGVKGILAAAVAAAVLAGVLWLQSSYLRERAYHSFDELRAYLDTGAVNSTGLHVEFLRKSLQIVAETPLIGHGTGTIADQFRRAAAGETGAAGVASVNPHNQVFAVAIQLGAIGAAVLLAMWLAHFMLFRGGGLAAWAGMIVVIDNVASSMANSHLFDFGQGWLYVFGVGVAGGMVLRKPGSAPRTRRDDSMTEVA